jgi:DNA repair exonuclease SbcCD nuclease subunit
MSPYALVADVHLHAWSAFASVDAEGVNSRLRGLLSEIERAANVVRSAGGMRIVIAGDLFHVRGKIAPSVLNPVAGLFMGLIDEGFDIVIMPGNHDLEGKVATVVNSAVTVLGNIGCTVMTGPRTVPFSGDNDQSIYMVPWVEDLTYLRDILKHATCMRREFDLILHAPVNGVIPGLPDTGLTPEELSKLGFKRVFVGHYHNHKEFPGGIYSIGALAHHTWSDVGSKAGFLLVEEDTVTWNKSHLPEFIEMSEEEDESDFELRVPENFVRMKIRSAKNSDVEAARKWALDRGAAGVIVLSVKEETKAREASGVSIKSGASLESSVAEFVRAKFPENTKAIETAAQACLAEAVEA